jgi:hypothetical protein
LHGTGLSGAPVTLVLGSTDPTPRAEVYGDLTTGAEWSDVPPPGAKKLSRFSYARNGVHIRAFATFESRSFWLAHNAESFDRVLWVRPNQKVRVLGVDSGEAIVEVDEVRARPSLVTARAACDDLGTDTTVHVEETPLPGLPVHAKNVRWLHLRAQPNGPVERDVRSETSPITKTTVQNGFVLVHVRFDAVDATGWVAASELTERSGGYGMSGIGGRSARTLGACAGAQRRVKKTSALRVGPTADESEAFGEVSENAQARVREVDGRYARVDFPPCEIMAAANQSFWIEADALD